MHKVVLFKVKTKHIIFAFTKIFQMIFVVPVILQLRINIQLESEIKHASSISTTTANTVTLSSTSTSVTATATESGTTNPSLTTAGPTEENECDDSKIHLVRCRLRINWVLFKIFY